MQWYRTDRLKFRGGGCNSRPPGGLGCQFCKAYPEANVLRGVRTPPLYNYKTSSGAALKRFPGSETPIAAEALRSRVLPGTNPAKIRRAPQPSVPAGVCAGTAPSHFSRAKRGRTAPLPPSTAGGSPAPPDWQPPLVAPSCSPSCAACKVKFTGREVWVL